MIAQAPVSAEESQCRSRKAKGRQNSCFQWQHELQNCRVKSWLCNGDRSRLATGEDILAFPNLRPCIFATYLYQCQCFYATQLSCARELAAYFLKKIQQELVQCKAAGALLPTQGGSGNMRLAVGRTAAV